MVSSYCPSVEIQFFTSPVSTQAPPLVTDDSYSVSEVSSIRPRPDRSVVVLEVKHVQAADQWLPTGTKGLCIASKASVHPHE